MKDLNNWIERFVKMQHYGHGNVPLVVVLPDGTKMRPVQAERVGDESVLRVEPI